LGAKLWLSEMIEMASGRPSPSASAGTNGYIGMNARGAALGVSKSEAAKKLLEQMVEAAGRDFVLKVYRERVIEHAAQLQKGAA